MAIKKYNYVENQPIYIGTSALNINSNNFYGIVLNSYQKIHNNGGSSIIEGLPTQNNIYMIQQIYLDLAESEQKIVIAGIPISFSDDVWDFTSLYKAGKMLGSYRFEFKNDCQFTDYQLVILKLFVFYLITEYGIHNGCNKTEFVEIKKLFDFMNQSKITLIDNLSVSDYKKFYNQTKIKYTTMVKRRRYLKEFLEFYSIIANDVFTKEINNWFNDIETVKIQADIEQNKTKLLPSSFYNKYTSLLYNAVFDENEIKYNRGYYGLLYIGTQTGLRASEIAILRVQDLEIISFRDKSIGILHYRSTKSGNGKNNVYDEGKTNANNKVIAVYEMLASLFKEERITQKVDFLVPRDMNAQSNGRDKSLRSNISSTALENTNIRFCVKYNKELNLLNTLDFDSFEGCVTYNEGKLNRFIPQNSAIKYGIKNGDKLSYPIIKQFRVYVASELRERGVDDRTTAYLFNHHCVEMYGYYARPKHSVQEDIDFSREIVRDVVQDKTKILGPKGEALMEKINGIIKANNLNVEKDLDTIIEKVCNEVPIRAKTGGFCMKSNPRRQCRHDAKTDEFLCAYGCCPNHCHMYFMLPITYDKVLTLKKTYDYNISAGFDNAAEKEGYKFISVVTKEFLPELKETYSELKRQSKAQIIEKHPEMDSVINRLNEIEQEVIEWKNQIEIKLSLKQ